MARCRGEQGKSSRPSARERVGRNITLLEDSLPFFQDLISPAPCFRIKHSCCLHNLYWASPPLLLFLPTASCRSVSRQTTAVLITPTFFCSVSPHVQCRECPGQYCFPGTPVPTERRRGPCIQPPWEPVSTGQPRWKGSPASPWRFFFDDALRNLAPATGYPICLPQSI